MRKSFDGERLAKTLLAVFSVVGLLLLLTAIGQSVEVGGVNLFNGVKIAIGTGTYPITIANGHVLVGTGANAYLYSSDGANVATPGAFMAGGDVTSSSFVLATTAGGGFRSDGSNTALLQGFPSDGASARGVNIRWGGGGSNAIAKIGCFQNGTTDKLCVYQDGELGMNTASTPTYAEGKVFYDQTYKTLAYYNDNANVTMNVGQEDWVRVWNSTGSTIANGKAVYINGRDATSNLPTIALADADAAATAEALGVVTHSCSTASACYVTTFGRVHDFDTSGLTAGSPFYLSSTAGGLTSTVPAAPAYQVRLGMVGRSDASVGWVLVQPGLVKTSESTGVSSGAWSVTFIGAVIESVNGSGAYTPISIGTGTKFRQVSCTCRLAGSGGTDGVFLNLMEGGVAAGQVELSGGDSNACNDTAGTILVGDFNYTPGTNSYTLQFDSHTDCAVNPTDCACNVDVTR